MVGDAAVRMRHGGSEMKEEKSCWSESEDLKSAPASALRNLAAGAGALALRRKEYGCNYPQMAARMAPNAPHTATVPTTFHSRPDPHVVHAPPCNRERS